LKDIKEPELHRKENHLVKATVIVNNAKIVDVPCKVFLPERIQEKPYLVLGPARKDANGIRASFEVSLYATTYGYDKKRELTIKAPKVYIIGSSTKHWGGDISHTTVVGEPQDLHVVKHFNYDKDIQRTQISFWISPNQFLTPSMFPLSSHTGNLKYNRTHKLRFTIKNKVKLVFDKYFRNKTIENGDFVQWSFLVACTEVDCPADDVSTIKKNILPDIDDFLLIASFAARQRTACTGWTSEDKNTQATFYRGNYVFPDFDRNKDIDDGLIDRLYFEKFVKTCYSAFLKYENKLAIRNALYSLVPNRSRTVENTFLHVFAGLETMILDFRRLKNLEFIVPQKDWPSFRNYLKKCIKDSTDPKLVAEQRSSMYHKLNELNRVSLQEAYNLFCKEYSIDLTDLWPIFKENNLVGLVDIRNKLIHGDPFPKDVEGTLLVAEEHLAYVLERVLVRILRWNVDKTQISPRYLKGNISAIRDMPSARKKLTEYINSTTEPTL